MTESRASTGSLVVWVVATAAGGEALLEAFSSWIHEEFADLGLWGIGSIALFFAALLVERIKVRRGEYA